MSTFYAHNTLKEWQTVLGPSMHYHVGGDLAVRNLYPFIDNNSSILDIGCGWGGPATMLANEKQCFLHGVTNSQQQHEYYPFPSTLADANHYVPDTHYDTALFIESFCHLRRADKLLRNLKPHTSKVIIKDYIWEDDWYNDEWQMYFRTPQTYHDLLRFTGYDVIHSEIDTTADVYESSLYWYNNIETLPHIQFQIKLLHSLTSAVLESQSNDFVKLILLVATPQ